ncbi:MAG: tyrosine-type recombinase/integrase [Halomonas sp.]|nr:tyrosine-type recombinase/integrase [Halomonas sp.]
MKKVKGGWKVDIWPDGRYGKRVRKTLPTQAEAKRFEAQLLTKAAQGEDYTPKKKDRRRLLELVQLWYDMHGATLKDGQSRLAKLHQLAGLMENPYAYTIRPASAAKFRQFRLEQGLSPNTVNHDIAYLRAVFNVLIQLGEWKGDNPFAAIKAIRLPERELSYLTHEQIKRLFEELKQSRNKHVTLIATLCLSTGARWSEAQYLRSELVRDGRVTYVDTKNGRSRSVPLSDHLYQRLKAHGPQIGRLFPRDAYQAFTNAINNAGIALPKGQRTHVLRHTFASHFIMNGGNLLTLQKILGHQSIQMTMRYAHVAPDHLTEAVTYGPKF